MNRREGIMANHIHIAWAYKRFLTMLKFVIFFLLLTILYGKTAFAAWDFNYTGNVQSWTCPVTGTYKLEVWGAQAGYNYFQWGHNGTEGAQGGYATGEVSLSKGTTLYICVGGRGGQSVDRYGGGGGYNGGAKGGNGIYSTAGGGSGGGGATHIALNTNRGVLSNYSSNQNEILVVAGGGGGSTYSQPGCAGGDSHAPYHFGQGQNANNGVYNHHEGGGGGGGGWYGGQYGSDEAYRGNYGMGPAHGGSNYVKDSLSKRSASNGGRSGNGFARITSTHTHSYTKQVQDKAPTCTVSGSGHYECPTDGARNGATYSIPALGHNYGEWSDWTNISNTQQQRTQKCSRCGDVKKETRTRTYYVNINVISPEGYEDMQTGYFQISTDGVNWSAEVRNEDHDSTIKSTVHAFTYNSPLYIRFTRPYYDYYEFKKIAATTQDDQWFNVGYQGYQHPTVPTKELEQINSNTWEYNVTLDRACIEIYTAYKHTTLTIDPNGGSINGNTGAQVLSPQLQYSTSQWNSLFTKEPSRAGYTFTGWYDAPTGGTKVYDEEGACIFGTQYFDGNGKCLCTKDLTLYAHWDVIPYKINTILLGGTVSGIPKTYTIEDDFTLPDASLSGFDFSGWTMSCKQGHTRDNGVITRINVTTPTKPLHIAKGTIGDIILTANYTKSGTNDDNGHNKTPDDNGSPDHITDTGDRKTPLVTDGGTKHNMFRVTK